MPLSRRSIAIAWSARMRRSWATEAGLSLADALARITTGPAAVLGTPEASGRIQIDGPADLCVFDPNEGWVVSRATLLSQGAHSPYVGRELVGRVRCTLVGGRPVWERARA